MHETLTFPTKEAFRSELARSADLAGPQSSPLIMAEGLAYVAGGKRLIDDVDLAIGAGRRTVVMGANGAGKSLLLRLLHGLITPSAGEVRWQGRALDRAGQRQQAMVFQRPVMLRRSVLGNLRFALRVRKVDDGSRRARELEALRQGQLEELAHRPARVLSGGEQQRLAVVRALACDPEVLFLDEPTSSLDPASTQAIEELINRAHEAGVSIVMVTHDAAQARRLGDDVIFMAGGRVAETGPIAQVLEAPRSQAARAWVESHLFFTPQHLRPV